MKSFNPLKSLLFYLLLLTSCISWGQNINSISGQVVDANGEIQMGNVIVLNPTDSSLIQGSSFMNTAFEVNKIDLPKVIVQFSSLLFEDTSMLVNYENQADIDLGIIEVNTGNHDLKEVTVKGKIARILEKENGTIAFTIDKTSLASSNSVQEILSKTPGVIQSEEGFEVVGKETTIFYLNGQRITEDQLDLILPSNIKNIEIIRNPSAKYDADGGAIIKINTIDNVGTEGYQIKLQQSVSHTAFAGTISNSTILANYAKKALKLTGSLDIYGGKEREILHTTRVREAEAVYLDSDVTTDWRWNYLPSPTVGLGIHYDLNSSSYWSLKYSGLFQQINNSHLSSNTIIDSEGDNYYDSFITGDQSSATNSISTNYQKQIDTLGSSLFIGGQYSLITNDRNNYIDEKSLEQGLTSTRLIQNLYEHKIDIYSAQLDYEKHFNPKHSLEIGTKLSQVVNDAKLDFLVANEEAIFMPDNNISNSFNYTESIGAAYVNYNRTINLDLDFSMGLRSEYTHYVLALANEENQDIQNNFLNLFPNLSINYKLPNQQNINLSYSSSLRRPRYSQLNPVLYYQDAYTSIQGNPDLVFQKTHNIEMVTTWLKTNIKVGYNYTFDPLGARAIRGEGDYSYILKPVNYGYEQNVYTSLSKQYSKDWFSTQNTLTLSYNEIIESDLSAVRIQPKPHIYFYTNNTFNISETLKLGISYWYWGNLYEGITHREDMANLSFTLEKSFWNKRLLCTFTANDVFNTTRPSGYYSVGETDIFFERQRDDQFYRLSISYQFGNLKKVSYKNKATGTNEIRRAN